MVLMAKVYSYYSSRISRMHSDKSCDMCMSTSCADIQNSKYPNIPTGHSHHGKKSRRRRRKSGFWRWLRGIRRQQNRPKGDSTESLEPCLGALAELTLEGAVEEEPAKAAHPSSDNGNLDKWTAWRTPQK
uniref:Rev protein n=1 Tax=Caprine arthritis encephalitis virus TaxID=11660 RepID=A0A1I9KI28_CAEV|nr:rev protein [Caprine arthritis encephalitis virus]